ncbi:5-carboxymethyl-2-hydroxymuconate Delta-isomerase [Flavobacteriaceae bacterium]|nr:5-carboxymethyl-2-hydroxymuconate Delta-isomerase [Flavobacteriaceae bacterium]MDB4560416.1 5-carboxymethyl-2-hydroxymuconate Delta-isomerase [Flavobacteriaceae bacterium]MDC3319469.1 5-carboxymethyl-2-hydroxymuconate Delta-isomerase [Flavobacteriaceae bacterium]
MPHFIVDCSENILELKDPKEILNEVFETAFSTGLFSRDAIKVRLNPFKHSLVLGGDLDFIHVFGNIMEGRTLEQKADLSRKIVSKLNQLFPEVPIISMNIRDLEKSSYINKTML